MKTALLRRRGGSSTSAYIANNLRPDLVADMAEGRYAVDGARSTFASVFGFSRASGATYTDAGGVIQTVSAGEARLNHHVWDGSAWVNAGLLIESEARTNLVVESNDFADATWTKIRSSITENSATSPDGSLNASKIVESTDANVHYISSPITTASGESYTFSTFVKADERQGVQLRVIGSSSYINGFLDVSDGSTNIITGDVNVEDFGNGWLRFSITGVADSTSSTIYIYISDNPDGGNNSYTGDGTSGIYIYGAQFEQGSTPSSYIPTSGSTATRAAETLTIAAANLPYPGPVYLSANLVDDFTLYANTTSATGVAGDGSLSFTDGTLTIERNTTDAAAWLDFATDSAKVYEITYRVVSGTAVFRFGGGPIFSSQTAGTYTRYLGNLQGLRFWPQNTSSTVVIDNISVREINPLAVSIGLEGRVTYADEGTAYQHLFWNWSSDAGTFVYAALTTVSTTTGRVDFRQNPGTGVADQVLSGSSAYSPGINVPFKIASRHGSTFINGAVGGTALTEDTTPVALPDLSTTDLELAPDFMGTLKTFRMWGVDIGDSGLEETTA